MISKIRKIDKEIVYDMAVTTFSHNFPQLPEEDVAALAAYLTPLMCRKIAKTPNYQQTQTITVQAVRDAFGAVLAERILHKDVALEDSVPTSEVAAMLIRKTEDMDDGDSVPSDGSAPSAPSADGSAPSVPSDEVSE